MPLYFFAAYDDGRLITDEFGLELENLDEAQDQAAALLPDIAREKLPSGEYHEFTCHVRDQCGRPVYRGRLIFEGEQLVHNEEGRSSVIDFGIASLR